MLCRDHVGQSRSRRQRAPGHYRVAGRAALEQPLYGLARGNRRLRHRRPQRRVVSSLSDGPHVGSRQLLQRHGRLRLQEQEQGVRDHGARAPR